MPQACPKIFDAETVFFGDGHCSMLIYGVVLLLIRFRPQGLLGTV
ncbi:hypothetical protein [Azospirillum endophyticum]